MAHRAEHGRNKNLKKNEEKQNFAVNTNTILWKYLLSVGGASGAAVYSPPSPGAAIFCCMLSSRLAQVGEPHADVFIRSSSSKAS